MKNFMFETWQVFLDYALMALVSLPFSILYALIVVFYPEWDHGTKYWTVLLGTLTPAFLCGRYAVMKLRHRNSMF